MPETPAQAQSHGELSRARGRFVVLLALLLVGGFLQAMTTPAEAATRLRPSPATATKDIPDLYRQGCHLRVGETEPRVCWYGTSSARKTIALVGDSKIAQWAPALRRLAKSRNWKIRTYTKSGCPFMSSAPSLAGKRYWACKTWGRKVMERLTTTQRPDLVITSSTLARAFEPDGRITRAAGARGLADHWQALADRRIEVVVLADNPNPPAGRSIPDCVAANRSALRKCWFDRTDAIGRSGAPIQEMAADLVEAEDISPGVRPASTSGHVYWMDLSRTICPGWQCGVTTKDILIYRNGSHLTATYTRTMSAYFGWSLAKIGVR